MNVNYKLMKVLKRFFWIWECQHRKAKISILRISARCLGRSQQYWIVMTSLIVEQTFSNQPDWLKTSKMIWPPSRQTTYSRTSSFVQTKPWIGHNCTTWLWIRIIIFWRCILIRWIGAAENGNTCKKRSLTCWTISATTPSRSPAFTASKARRPTRSIV